MSTYKLTKVRGTYLVVGTYANSKNKWILPQGNTWKQKLTISTKEQSTILEKCCEELYCLIYRVSIFFLSETKS